LVIIRKVVPLALEPIVHESYGSPYTSSNDIALLKLAEAVDLNIYTPACLPTLNTDYTGKIGRTYGELQTTHVQNVHMSTCPHVHTCPECP
jgi:hypothetical protein